MKFMKEEKKQPTAEKLLKWAKKEGKEKELMELSMWLHQQAEMKKALQELSKKPELTDKAIKVQKEIVREMEEALKDDVEWPSERQRLETILAGTRKDKRGWFSKFLKRIKERRLKKIINKPPKPKKLNEHTRKILEESVEKHKRIISTWEDYKKGKIKI